MSTTVFVHQSLTDVLQEAAAAAAAAYETNTLNALSTLKPS
jgi:hypothetical protein